MLAAFKNARDAFARVAEECNVSEECNDRRSIQTGVAREQAGDVCSDAGEKFAVSKPQDKQFVALDLKKQFVALDLGPTGKLLAPYGDFSLKKL